ncbi:hypothetical protein AMTRI_Chr02g254860 [Amborella trichopoda]
MCVSLSLSHTHTPPPTHTHKGTERVRENAAFNFGFVINRLGRLQDSNAVLSHFNDFSEQCYAEVVSDFTRSTHVLRSMKADLDHIFQTLRSMKAKISSHYPDAFKEASIADQRPDLETPL